MCRARRIAAGTIVAVSMLGVAIRPAPADSQQRAPIAIKFAAGASSAKVATGVIRGESDTYSLEARAGQQASFRIAALEDNAEFELFAPSARVTKGEGGLDVQGRSIGSGTNWAGRLPQSGVYIIRVGGTRGNATYDLTASVK